MDEIEIGVLEACLEYVCRQHEMLPQIAAALGVEESQVFHAWALRRCIQRGKLADAEWTYFFHGLECDFKNQRDGRCLRMDFGPRGRVGILNSWGVLQFIMTSVPPWHEFPNLRDYFAKKGPPFDQDSGAWGKMAQVWDRLESKGFFEQAEPNLVALQAKFTTRGSDGLTYVQFPPETAEQTRVDCSVAHRQQLSRSAIHFLDTRRQDGTLFVSPTAAGNPGGGQIHTAVK